MRWANTPKTKLLLKQSKRRNCTMSASIDSTRSWLCTARTDDVVKRSLKVSLLVGSILVAINHGDLLMNGAAGSELFWKVPMTYCVPYAVSTFASVDALRRGK